MTMSSQDGLFDLPPRTFAVAPAAQLARPPVADGLLHVGGLDLSATSTGMARIYGKQLTTWAFKPKARKPDEAREQFVYNRQELIIRQVLAYLGDCHVIMAEDLVWHAKGSSILDLAGLRAIVMLELHRAGLTVVHVNQSIVKAYATGNGNADKQLVYRAALLRFGVDEQRAALRSDDEGDAAWLAQMGADHYGCPLITVPKAQRERMYAKAIRGRRKGLPVIDWADVPVELIAAAAAERKAVNGA
jgi:crossover junction endodeoxyribonuclease RuvC